MSNVTVTSPIDIFLKSPSGSSALDSIGGLAETEFAGLSTTLATDTELSGLSATYLSKTEFAGLSTTFGQDSLTRSEYAGMSAGFNSIYTTLCAENVTQQDEFRDNIVAARKSSGPFATAHQASMLGGVYGESYFTSNYDLKILRAGISAIAFLGDSVTSQGLQGLNGVYGANNYAVFAKTLDKSKWFFVPYLDLGANSFSFGGFRSDQIAATTLSAVSASNAQVVVIAWGINDYQQFTGTLATYLSTTKNTWDLLRSVGKYPIQMSIIPPVLHSTISEPKFEPFNNAMRQLCLDNNIPYCDWHNAMALSSGSISANPAAYFDNLHPNDYGASIMGRELHRTFETFLDYTFDVSTATGQVTALMPNWQLSATTPTGTPTGWSVFNAGGTSAFGTYALSSTQAGHWWTLPLIKGDSSSSFSILNFTDNIFGPVSGKNIDGYVEMEVLSGEVTCNIGVWTYNPATNAGQTYDMSGAVNTKYTPEDGVFVLRTAPKPAALNARNAYPTLQMTPQANAIIRIRQLSIRQVPWQY